MLVDVESVTINLVTEDRHFEITVVTASGETIFFPRAEVEIRPGGSPPGAGRTMYFYATKTETSPAPRLMTLIVEQPENEGGRERLDISPLDRPDAPFFVREAHPGDRAAVVDLVPRLRAFGPPPLRPPEALDAGERRTLDAFFDAPPGGARLWVAEAAEGAVLGFAYAEPAVDYFTGETYGHLGILAVAAEAEGRGAGRALIETFERWAADSGFRFVTLNVFADNARAVAFYERAGYRPDTLRYVKEV
jgi:ribosomal protein S18 acetylase RimI-like enzyme